MEHIHLEHMAVPADITGPQHIVSLSISLIFLKMKTVLIYSNNMILSGKAFKHEFDLFSSAQLTIFTIGAAPLQT